MITFKELQKLLTVESSVKIMILW